MALANGWRCSVDGGWRFQCRALVEVLRAASMSWGTVQNRDGHAGDLDVAAVCCHFWVTPGGGFVGMVFVRTNCSCSFRTIS